MPNRLNSFFVSLLFLSPLLSAQQLQFELNQHYNPDSNTWTDLSRQDYSYDVNMDLNSSTFFEWDTLMWRRLNEQRYVRQANGNMDSVKFYALNAGNLSLRGFDLYYYSNPTNPDSIVRHSEIIGLGLMPERKERFQYDSQGNTLEKITDVYFTNRWEPREKLEQSFTATGLLLSQKFYVMDFNGWYLMEQALYTYDNVGRLTDTYWLGELGDTLSQLVYHYQVNGLLDYIEGFAFVFGQAQLYSRSEHSFNTLNKLDTITYFVRQTGDSTLSLSYRTLYGYSPFIGLDENMSMRIEIYPNPTKDYLQIESQQEGTKTLQLYNMSGLLLREWSTEESSLKLDMMGLNKGEYLLRVQSKGSIHSQIILKQ